MESLNYEFETIEQFSKFLLAQKGYTIVSPTLPIGKKYEMGQNPKVTFPVQVSSFDKKFILVPSTFDMIKEFDTL